MSKYFDGYAKFDYKEMSKEKLITELKEKVRYIDELKRNNNKEIAKIQSIKDKQIADLEAKLAESDAYKLRIELAGATETIEVLRKQLAEKNKGA